MLTWVRNVNKIKGLDGENWGENGEYWAAGIAKPLKLLKLPRAGAFCRRWRGNGNEIKRLRAAPEYEKAHDNMRGQHEMGLNKKSADFWHGSKRYMCIMAWVQEKIKVLVRVGEMWPAPVRHDIVGMRNVKHYRWGGGTAMLTCSREIAQQNQRVSRSRRCDLTRLGPPDRVLVRPSFLPEELRWL